MRKKRKKKKKKKSQHKKFDSFKILTFSIILDSVCLHTMQTINTFFLIRINIVLKNIVIELFIYLKK